MNPKLLPKTGGIYCIKNIINGKMYIGRTYSFYKRCYQYLYSVLYKELKELGFGNAICSFSRTQEDTVICKGVKIHRRKLES